MVTVGGACGAGEGQSTASEPRTAAATTLLLERTAVVAANASTRAARLLRQGKAVSL